MADDFREGVRSGDPSDPCQVCGSPCIIASDFKKFGTHRVRFCLKCAMTFHNGEMTGPIKIWQPPVA